MTAMPPRVSQYLLSFFLKSNYHIYFVQTQIFVQKTLKYPVLITTLLVCFCMYTFLCIFEVDQMKGIEVVDQVQTAIMIQWFSLKYVE